MTENNRDEYLKQYTKDHKEEIRATKRKSYHKLKNQPEKVAYKEKYYEENKETILARSKEWKEKNKDYVKEQSKEYKEKNKEIIKIKNKEYKDKNKESIKIKNAEYRETHRKGIKRISKIKYAEKQITFLDGKYTKKSKIPKEDIINLLGGKCAQCNITDLDTLTVDHINNDGAKDKKEMNLNSSIKQVKKLIKEGWSLEQLKEKFQVLCWNHNCAKSYRGYFDLLDTELTYKQRWRLKLLREAYDLFGPCKTCDDTNLKYLTISHVHDDGAERKRNGEKCGTDLLNEFRKINWNESIKEDFCLECFNCNCSRQVRKQRNSSQRGINLTSPPHQP